MRILFLGCSGGRRITFQQKRASGGFLVMDTEGYIHVDPGPGAFIRLIQLGIDPSSLRMLVVSHRHMDHVADVNTLIEARTMGGWNPGGVLVAPEDALEGEDPVVFRYHRGNLSEIHLLKEGLSLKGSVSIRVAMRHQHHGVETYGLIFEERGTVLGYITDGRYHPQMEEAYGGCNILIVNTTFRNPRDLDHLSLEDAVRLARAVEPELLILNHFGAEIVFWGLDRAAEYVQEKSGVRTIAAREFLTVESNPYSVSRAKLKNPLGIAYRR